MDLSRKNRLVRIIFLLNGILFIIGGGYLVISRSLAPGQFLKFFLVAGIFNMVRVMGFINKPTDKKLDLFILFVNIAVALYLIGYLQLVIILISIVGLLICWKTPFMKG